jgi:hypothetical protein
MVKHGADLAQTPTAPPPPPPGPPGALLPAPRGRNNPNAGRQATHVAMNGGRGPAMTGGPAYLRDGSPVPYREPGSRKAEEAFAVLLEAGANPNATGPDGATLLHQAANAGNLEMIRALAKANVDFTLKNKDGKTALEAVEAPAPAGRGGRAGGPPAGGGRGGRGNRASRDDVAKLLRELMGLPPAAPSVAAATPAPAADAGEQK